MNIFRLYIYKRKKELLVLLLLLVSSTLLAAPGPYYIKVIVDDVLLNGDMRVLYLLISIIAVVIVLQVVFSVLQSLKVSKFVQGLLIEVRQDLFQHLFKVELNDFNKRSRGEYLTRITSDIEIVGGTLTNIIINLLVNSLIVIMYLSISIYINWKLAIIGMVTLPLFIRSIHMLGGKLHVLSGELQKAKSKVLSNLEEDFTGIKHILFKNAVTQRFKLYTDGLRETADLSIKVSVWSSLLSCLSSLIAVVGPLFTLVLGVYFVRNGDLTTGSLLAFYGYIGALYQPVSQISSVVPQVHVMKASANRLNEVFQLPLRKLESSIEPYITNSITFNHVSYVTEDGIALLKDVTLELKPAQVTRISGVSGSGKTTLLNLLMGVIQPTMGEILCGETDWKVFSRESIAKKIAFVSQDYFLFTGSVMDNLMLGLEGISFDEVEKVCKVAGISEEIELLPYQYDTRIGQNGVALSGGQIQRLMIARALLQKPKVLVLDEATSELDQENESIIFKRIQDSFSGVAIIIVTHKLNQDLKVSREYKLYRGTLISVQGL